MAAHVAVVWAAVALLVKPVAHLVSGHVFGNICCMLYGMCLEISVACCMACVWKYLLHVVWHVFGSICCMLYGMCSEISVAHCMTCVRTRVETCVRTCVRTGVRTCVRTGVRTRVRIGLETCGRTYEMGHVAGCVFGPCCMP